MLNTPNTAALQAPRTRPNQSQRAESTQADSLVYQIGNNLYINLTDRCTLTCGFCPKHNGCTDVKGHQLYLSRRPETADIITLIKDPTTYDEIVFCGYGEPTLRLKQLLEIAHWVKQNAGNTRLNTDGLGNKFHKRNIVPELAECIDGLSISLNAQDAATYQHHCAPALKDSFQAVLDFIEEAAHHISPVYASAIDGLEGVDINACRRLVEDRGAIFRRRVLDEVG